MEFLSFLPYGNDRRDSSGYRPKYRKEAPAKLSLWQRFLGLFGIRPSKNNKYAARDKAAAKTNTRVARNRQDRVSAPKQPVSNRRLYVGNLSYEATESDLEDVFKGIGEVNSVEIIYNPRTHKSKGYAFVEMKKMEDAIRSVDILHNQPFMGRNLLVSGANERQEQPRQPREDRAPPATVMFISTRMLICKKRWISLSMQRLLAHRYAMPVKVF